MSFWSSLGSVVGKVVKGAGAITSMIPVVGDSVSSGLSSLGDIIDGSTSDQKAKEAAATQFNYQQQLAADQYSYNKQLAEQANANNVANATTAYNRQIELTRSTPLLTQLGKSDAGMSTAQGEGGFNASAASVNSASASPAGSVSLGNAPGLSSYIQAYAQQAAASNDFLAKMLLAGPEREKNRAAAKATQIDNVTRSVKNTTEIENLKKSGRISDEEAKRLERANRIGETYDERKEKAVTIGVELDNKIKETTISINEQVKQLNAENISILKSNLKKLQFEVDHIAERYYMELSEMKSRTSANFAAATSSAADAAYKDVCSTLEKAKVPYASSLARALCDDAKYKATQSFNEAIVAGKEIGNKEAEAEINRKRAKAGYWIIASDCIKNILTPLAVAAGVAVKAVTKK